MSRYAMICRLRGPAILLLIGILALLHQMGVIPYFWRLLWPLLLIVLGLLLLAERAVLAWEGYPPYFGAPGQGAGQETNQGTVPSAPTTGAGPGAPSPSAGQGAANPASEVSGAIVPPQWQEFDDKKKGQS